ncbi:zinc-binding dehydrogenase [Streptacidiphilus sp. P02-A3a]|uniref:quinone oxidoreductase family protein n=1 Tax=Streptacidiphilus sp. P02-A3a TaxID=2704468 RepID=UPI0015FBAB31|nr:zinc-binding dehydrogenase [Streptacidiphilus sp. P02-A3a]QMU68303.1 zinc-binding dehydrogenase [Streptacidiphilus sp. P02-A3a]
MRRVRFYEYGGPEVLKLEDVETPTPGPGQVLVRTEGIGANFVDTMIRRGPSSPAIFHRPLPGKLTGDVVGTVESVGEGVDGALVGQRVAVPVIEDAFADYVLVGPEWLAVVPDGLDLGAASTLPVAAPVALRVLRIGQLAAGETVLVHAASGNIGHLVVQLARILGAGKVIATVGSAAKLDFARSCGADVAVDYSAEDWDEQVRAAAPGGVDVVLDSVGGEVLRRSIALLAPHGRAVVYGVAGGQLLDLPISSIFGLKSVTGFALMAWRAADPKQARADVDEVAGYALDGRLRVAVHARLPLAEAAEAHRILDSRAQLGRVLLVP